MDSNWQLRVSGTSVDDGHGGFHRPLLLGWNHFLDRQLIRLHYLGGWVAAAGDVRNG